MRWTIALLLALGFAVTAPWTPADAGGWALVTLDSPPAEVRAGERLSLGFMVRQHGVTPIDYAFDDRRPMKPVLTARNISTEGTVRTEARKEGVVGHFVVDVTFPSAGTWEWEITPPPFAGTRLPALTVRAAAGERVTPAVAAADEAKIAAQTSAPPVPSNTAGGSDHRLIAAGLLALALAGGVVLVLLRRRDAMVRLP